MFTMQSKEQNVFQSFLESLKVKHTRVYSNKYFREHPYKYNLFGISKMLSDYGIANKGFKTDNKAVVLQSLETPFIAHAGGDLVVVMRINKDTVHYRWYGKEIKTSLDEFIESWSGVVLLAETNENSIEPNYKENRKKEWSIILQQYGLLAAVGLLAGLCVIHNRIYDNIGWMLVQLVNLFGIYISYLLVQKQLHVHSEYADKLCSLFKQSDCNNVLESKASKLGGVIGWSEIGLGYFISNVIILLLFPSLFSYLAIINIFALPYTLWSVWYQKFRAKQWCPLCLIVQALLWTVFVINLAFASIQLPAFKIEELLVTGIVYFIPPIVINLLVPLLAQANQAEQITQEFNALKTNEDVFAAFLKKQPHYEVDKSTSKILLGNPESGILVTILTNPHCEPCSRMHTRIEKLLQDTNHSICIQYIFSSFNEELKSSAHFLTATYLMHPLEKAKLIYNEWFREGKDRREEFFQQYECTHNELIDNELFRHEEWKETSQLRATPTVLINGYKLPTNYKIEDLKYFTDLNVNIK